MKLIFDIETDGLLDTVSKVHCIVARDIETDKEYIWSGDECRAGWEFLQKAEMLVGHNIMGFDIPALEIVFGKMLTLLTHDTLVMTRTIWPDRRDRGFQAIP